MPMLPPSTRLAAILDGECRLWLGVYRRGQCLAVRQIHLCPGSCARAAWELMAFAWDDHREDCAEHGVAREVP